MLNVANQKTYEPHIRAAKILTFEFVSCSEKAKLSL